MDHHEKSDCNLQSLFSYMCPIGARTSVLSGVRARSEKPYCLSFFSKPASDDTLSLATNPPMDSRRELRGLTGVRALSLLFGVAKTSKINIA